MVRLRNYDGPEGSLFSSDFPVQFWFLDSSILILDSSIVISWQFNSDFLTVQFWFLDSSILISWQFNSDFLTVQFWFLDSSILVYSKQFNSDFFSKQFHSNFAGDSSVFSFDFCRNSSILIFAATVQFWFFRQQFNSDFLQQFSSDFSMFRVAGTQERLATT